MEKDTTARAERESVKKVELAPRLRQHTPKKRAGPVPAKMTETARRRGKAEELLLQSFRELYPRWKKWGLLKKPR